MSYAGMDIAPLNSPQAVQAGANAREEAAVRRAATEFEALLLRQLTASLNSPKDDEEGESLFGNDAGTDMSRRMFSEQIADTMAHNGGIGLADQIVQQMLANKGVKALTGSTPMRSPARDAVHSLRENYRAQANRNDESAQADRAASNGKARVDIDTASRKSDVADRFDPVLISEASDDEATNSASSNTNATVSSNLFSSGSDADSDLAISFQPEQSAPRFTRPRRVFPFKEVADSSSVSSRNTANATSSGVVNAPAAHIEASKGTGLEPVQLKMSLRGPIRSAFGARRDPINGHRSFHKGIDIAAPSGTPIPAAATGRVVFAGRNGGYGNMVILEHSDGTRTRYGHASSLLVKAGETVESGQTIAKVGSTGHSTGPHLHFEVIKKGRFVNPLAALPKGFALARR